MKNFNSENILRDLKQKHCGNVYCSKDPNKMWEIWKSMLMETVDKHAPLKIRRLAKEIPKEFWNLWHFPMCSGAIYGKHLVMQCPPNGRSSSYNYKGKLSKVVDIIIHSH
jgi:hypothetical protein